MRRVLFVDDDPMLLAGLRNALRRYRNEWDMTFVCGGREGRAAVEAERFDALVSDVRMPDVDGQEVLRAARQHSPDTVRIVLSGQTDPADAARLVDLAHRYVAKPVSSALLFEVVEGACSRRDLLENAALRALVTGLKDLPPLPRSYARLSRVAERPDAGPADVAKIIADDPGLSARVLRVVNSAFFGLPQPMSTVGAAAVYLGINMLKALVLDAELEQAFAAGGLDARAADALLQRSRRAAAVVRKLAPNADLAFTACILADAGLLVLAMLDPRRSRERHAAASGDCHALAALEQADLGCDHQQVGAYLLSLWGLTADIVNAAAGHHTRPAALRGPPTTAQLVAVAFGAVQPRATGDDDWFEPVAALFTRACELEAALGRDRDA